MKPPTFLPTFTLNIVKSGNKKTEVLHQYAESAIIEDDAMTIVREHSHDLGITAVSPSVGAMLASLARLSGGRAVVETGTGAGVSSLWLLSGMAKNGILTTIDCDHDHQNLAREMILAAGVSSQRLRFITGQGESVLGKLTDSAYDMVFLDAPIFNIKEYLQHALRILRPGGALAIHGIAEDLNGEINDNETIPTKTIIEYLSSIDTLLATILPLGGGLLLATKDFINTAP